jgi:hypothetical protein
MGRPVVALEVGQTYGRLTVLARGPSRNRKAMWLCRCTCGTEKLVGGSRLSLGKTVSCGCARRERLAVRGPGHPAWKGSS